MKRLNMARHDDRREDKAGKTIDETTQVSGRRGESGAGEDAFGFNVRQAGVTWSFLEILSFVQTWLRQFVETWSRHLFVETSSRLQGGAIKGQKDAPVCRFHPRHH